jgi:hypothetical protein
MSSAISESILDECKRIAERMRSNLIAMLRGYHDLGNLLLRNDIKGERIRWLAKELGEGFSPTTLYRCRKFVQEYPVFETFIQEHGMISWRKISNGILVRQPRTNFNALKSQNEFQVVIEGLEHPFKLEPKVLGYYKYVREIGYKGDMGDFIWEVVDDFFARRGLGLGVLEDMSGPKLGIPTRRLK